MRPPPLPRSQRRRILFLLLGNILLLVLIYILLKAGSSFTKVLTRAGPDVAPIVLAGLGMTSVILAGAIDLSIASIIAVSGSVFGIFYVHGFPPFVCFIACWATACVLSLTNGWLIRRLRIPAIIVTLAGLPFYRGLALVIADWAIPDFGGNIPVHEDSYHGPGKFASGWILLIAVIGALLWENYGKTPRQWLALGNSDEACRLAGIAPGRVLQSAFLAAGVFLGLAALIAVTRVQTIEPARMLIAFELHIVGAVVLGGTNIFGGEGSFAGTILGAFFLYFISQVLTYAGASAYFQEAITGAIILGVIGMDCAWHRSEKRFEELA